MIYFDNSATTIPHPEVIDTYNKVAKSFFGNPSSLHILGAEAENLFIRSRMQIADLLQVKSNEIVFTSGGTEGNNLAIKGIALQYKNRGKHIITTEIEHASVYEACRSLENHGFDITYLPVNKDGHVDLDAFEKAIREDTILVSIMHVNNELGSIQPIYEIGKVVDKYPKIFFHVDDVQGFSKVPLNLREAKVDLCTYSGHKINGLKGTGILYVKENINLYPLFHGGGQEDGIRPGTENLPGAISLARAFRLAKEKEDAKYPVLKNLREYFVEKLANISGVMINSPVNDVAPHIINISVPNTKPEVIIHTLGEKGIFISTKSACSSREADENRVLDACGYTKERSSSALRISLSYESTKEEIDTFLTIFSETVQNLKRMLE